MTPRSYRNFSSLCSAFIKWREKLSRFHTLHINKIKIQTRLPLPSWKWTNLPIAIRLYSLFSLSRAPLTPSCIYPTMWVGYLPIILKSSLQHPGSCSKKVLPLVHYNGSSIWPSHAFSSRQNQNTSANNSELYCDGMGSSGYHFNPTSLKQCRTEGKNYRQSRSRFREAVPFPAENNSHYDQLAISLPIIPP